MNLDIMSVDSLGELMSYRKSRMPSMTTNPKLGIVPIACSTIANRISGEYLRKASITRLSGSLFSGKSAKRKMRFNTF